MESDIISREDNNSDLRDSTETWLPGAFDQTKLKSRKFSFSYEDTFSFDDLNFSNNLSVIFSSNKERSKSSGKIYKYLFNLFNYFFLFKKIGMEKRRSIIKKFINAYTSHITKEKDDQLKKAEELLAGKDEVIAEKDEVIAEKDELICQQKELLKIKNEENEQLKKEIEELKKKISK